MRKLGLASNLHKHSSASLKSGHADGIASTPESEASAALLRSVQTIVIDQETVGNTSRGANGAVSGDVEHATIVRRDAEIVVASSLNRQLKKGHSVS